MRLSLDEARSAAGEEPTADVIALNAALDKLATAEPEKARVVELRFFGGLSVKEAASVLGLGERTIERYWLYRGSDHAQHLPTSANSTKSSERSSRRRSSGLDCRKLRPAHREP